MLSSGIQLRKEEDGIKKSLDRNTWSPTPALEPFPSQISRYPSQPKGTLWRHWRASAVPSQAMAGLNLDMMLADYVSGMA